MPFSRFIAVALLASSSAALFGLAAMAKPLYKDECADLAAKRKTLLTADVQAALTRGPDWVKDHLDEEKLDQVREFLLVEEKVVFRCRGGGIERPKPVPLPDRKPGPPPLPVKAPDPGESQSQTVADTEEAADPESPEEGDSQAVADTEEAADLEAPEEGGSQAVADSDKTTRSKTTEARP